MIALIEVTEDGRKQHIIFDAGTDSIEEAAAEVRKVTKEYLALDDPEMSLEEYLDETFFGKREVDYLPIYVDVVGKKVLVNGL